MNYIKNKFFRLWNIFIKLIKRTELVIKLLFNKGDTIFLFGYPIHSNIGDLAQAYCIEKWLSDNYSNYKVFTFNWQSTSDLALNILKKKISKNDLIFGHSGYIFYDYHLELPIYRKVAELLIENRFIILPVTINILSDEILAKTIESLKKHPSLTLIARDYISYEIAKNNFKECKILVYPDFVTSLIGTRSYDSNRNGVLLCMRDDLEQLYTFDEINDLRKRIEYHSKTELTDTTQKLSFYDIKHKKEKIISDILNKYSTYKLIITDRYHGTIFSLIAGTPVIVISTNDHKVTSGLKWFPSNFSSHVYYADNLDTAYNLTKEILNRNIEYKLPSYFRDNYFSKLKLEL